MKTKFFTSFSTLQELKEQFRKLCLKLHPDKGGNETKFKAMVNEYEYLLKNFSFKNFTNERANFEVNMDEALREILYKVIHLQGVHIEIIGNWLWLSANTYPYRKFLKSLGFRFAGKKKAWYWKGYEYKKTSKKQFELNELRKIYGSESIENEQIKELN